MRADIASAKEAIAQTNERQGMSDVRIEALVERVTLIDQRGARIEGRLNGN